MNPHTIEDTELKALFLDLLQDIYWAERKLVINIPKLAKKAVHENLSKAFENHAAETEDHVLRLEKIFALIDEPATAKKCHAMAGLLDETDELASDFAGSSALDAALIAAAQKVEHYEIASYGTIRAFSIRLGLKEATALLTETIDEESAADAALTKIAEAQCNSEANHAA